MQNQNLNLPQPKPLPGSTFPMPYFFVGDNIFALHENLMKPYSKSAYLTLQQRRYNYRISRARITIENTFGIWVQRWKIFNSPLRFNLKTAESIIMATVLLHNFIITENLKSNDSMNEYYTQTGNDNDHVDTGDFIQQEDNRDLGSSSAQRQALTDNFSSAEGSVPWQDEYI